MKFIIKTKYEVGDKVWIMKENQPLRVAINKITIQGGEMSEEGDTANFGLVKYYLADFDKLSYGFYEEQLCDTFDQLRDRVFSESLREQ